MILQIVLPKKDIVDLKHALLLIIQVLNDCRCTWPYKTLEKARILIENVGAACKECPQVQECGNNND